jgi:hypothetical protein
MNLLMLQFPPFSHFFPLSFWYVNSPQQCSVISKVYKCLSFYSSPFTWRAFYVSRTNENTLIAWHYGVLAIFRLINSKILLKKNIGHEICLCFDLCNISSKHVARDENLVKDSGETRTVICVECRSFGCNQKFEHFYEIWWNFLWQIPQNYVTTVLG